jgi:cytoskeletal protein RodZ
VEVLGNKPKTARESKGYTIDHVSQEINISGRYLEFLEREDFSGFPGEPYILGFLKNYGTYLELDVNELLSLYRSLKIQAQPVPVEQLLKNPSPLPRILAVSAVTVAVLGIAAGGVWFFLRMPRGNSGETTVEVPPPVEYTMNTDSLERRFYLNDTVLVPLEDDTYKLELSGLGDTVTLTTPRGPVRLDLNQEVTVDLDNDGADELRITAADFEKNNSVPGALLRFDLETLPGLITGTAVESAALTPEALNAANTGLQAATVIFSSPNPYPFTLQSRFQGYCLFRWEILSERDRQGRNEEYFQRSGELDIQAQNGIRIGVSNAQAVKLEVIGGGRTVPVELGGAGEVVVAEIRWVRDEENRYRLILARVE